MNNIKKFLVGMAASAMLLAGTIMPVGAAAPWNVTGIYNVDFTCSTGCSGTYTHHMTLTQSGTNVTGDGGYPATGGDTYHWNITSGTQTGDSLNLTTLYDLGAAGTVMHINGTIASNGTVSGTWDDNYGGPRTGTFVISKGVSVPRILAPANGSTVSQAALVKVDWTDSVGSNPPFTYKYEAYSDPGYTSLVYASGVLTTSEIPTPGTPPGEYYIRVQAMNSSSDVSAWSNGPSNPYHYTVVLNNFAVPAECNQNIVYNKIEGTDGSDNITGTNGNDLILAKGGSDSVNGMGGDDCIVGGEGSNYLVGGTGNDVLIGGSGSDALYGNEGNDKLYGGAGSDYLNGGIGTNMLDGGAGSDSCVNGPTMTQCNP